MNDLRAQRIAELRAKREQATKPEDVDYFTDCIEGLSQGVGHIRIGLTPNGYWHAQCSCCPPIYAQIGATRAEVLGALLDIHADEWGILIEERE